MVQAGSVGVPRAVLGDLLGLAKRLGHRPVAKSQRPGRGRTVPVSAADDLVAMLPDVAEEGRPDPLRLAELGNQVGEAGDHMLARPRPDRRRRSIRRTSVKVSSRPGRRPRPGSGPWDDRLPLSARA